MVYSMDGEETRRILTLNPYHPLSTKPDQDPMKMNRKGVSRGDYNPQPPT